MGKGKISVARKLSGLTGLAVILFGGIFDTDDPLSRQLKKILQTQYSNLTDPRDPYYQGFNNGSSYGMEHGVLDALQPIPVVRDQYKPKPIDEHVIFNSDHDYDYDKLKEYTAGFADGNNWTYDQAYAATMQQRLKRGQYYGEGNNHL